MRTKWVSFILALSLLATGCGKVSNVTFLGSRAANPSGATNFTSSIAPTNGGFVAQKTALGNKATVSFGAATSAVRGTTSAGNQYQLNVAGSISQ